jgi:N utilization substance protein B
VGKRRKSRELALQCLYELDLRGQPTAAPDFADFWARHPASPEVREFAEELIRGAREHLPKIDELIAQYAEHWSPDRIAVVDRNILRQGIYELLWSSDVPPKVVINEALEVAKRFSTQESSRFINGILDRVRKERRTDL